MPRFLCVSVYLCLVVCRQRVCMCQGAERMHQPIHPVIHTVLPCLLATRRVPAAGCYLSVRTCDFSRLEWGDFHVWCVFESPLPISPLPPYLSRPVLLGCNVQGQPCCRIALVQIPVHSTPKGTASLKQGRLERVESQRLIIGCGGTRDNSEDPVGSEQKRRGKRR